MGWQSAKFSNILELPRGASDIIWAATQSCQFNNNYHHPLHQQDQEEYLALVVDISEHWHPVLLFLLKPSLKK